MSDGTDVIIFSIGMLAMAVIFYMLLSPMIDNQSRLIGKFIAKDVGASSCKVMEGGGREIYLCEIGTQTCKFKINDQGLYKDGCEKTGWEKVMG